MTEPLIHPTTLPNDLSPDRLRLRPAANGNVAVDAGIAGWRYLAFRTVMLASGDSIEVGDGDHETAIVSLFGGDLTVARPGTADEILRGRPTVFDGLPSAYYLPAGRTATIAVSTPGSDSTIAIATAPSRPRISADLRPMSIGRDDVRVEVRGAGRATRQINHIIAPDFPADRLLLVEVLTPAGNWSSWPPHKHDIDDMPNEAVLEEVYHYRFRRPEAWAVQRVYRPAGGPLGPARDAIFAVCDGEVVMVTDGYHPFAATDADDAYYLNVLAGDRRTMACSFDPALDDVRERWASMTPDPRVPFGESVS